MSVNLSIIIVNWNTGDALRQCVLSHFSAAHTCSLSTELIIIDNASTDDSLERLSSLPEYPSIQILRNDRNLGFPTAANQGLRLAQGEHLLLLNPDTLLRFDTYQKTYTFVLSHPDAGIVGIRTQNAQHLTQPSSWPEPSLLRAFFEAACLHRLLPARWRSRWLLSGYFDHNETRKVGMVMGSFFWITRTCLHQIGFLRDDVLLYGEDLDYCMRARRRGFHVYFTPQAEFLHLGNQSGALMAPEWRIRRTVGTLYWVLADYHSKMWVFTFCLLQNLNFLTRLFLSKIRRRKIEAKGGYVSSNPSYYLHMHTQILKWLLRGSFWKNLEGIVK